MKSLRSYFTLNESVSSQDYTLTFKGIDGGHETLEAVRDICTSAGIPYTILPDESIKVTVSKDKQKEIEKITELVTTFVSSVPTEDHENIGKELNKLVSQVDTIQELIDEFDSEEE